MMSFLLFCLIMFPLVAGPLLLIVAYRRGRLSRKEPSPQMPWFIS